MSLDKQAIALSKLGFLCFPRKETDVPTDEIYDKGFVVLDEKIRWDMATEGIAGECMKNSMNYFVEKILRDGKEKAEKGEFVYAMDYSTFCARHFLIKLSKLLDAEGFRTVLFKNGAGISWHLGMTGKALEYREIAQDVISREKAQEKIQKKTCTIM